MSYVDGFLIPVSRKKLKEYQRISKKAGKIWMEYGALDYKECSSDDIRHKGMRDFSKAAAAKSGEVVVFSYILYKSKKHRNAVNAKVMNDPRVHALCTPQNMPFDIKRMSYGGFKVFVDAK